MAGQRQPIELIVSKGAKHIGKAEIADRMQREVKPCADNITPPSYLTAAQKKHFRDIAGKLDRIGIMGETDEEALARYIIAEELYRQAVQDNRNFRKRCRMPEDAAGAIEYAEMLDKMDKRIDRYFKQAHAAASALGLTISSRCRLVVPKTEEEPKTNRFAQFERAAGE